MFSLPGYIGLHWFVIFQKDGLCFGGINFNIDIILFCLFFKKSWIIFEWDIAYQRFRLPIFERHCLPVRVFVSIHLFHSSFGLMSPVILPTDTRVNGKGGGQRFSIWEGLFFTTCAFLWSFVPRPIPIKIDYVVDLGEGEGKLLIMYPKLQVCFHTFKISKI